MPESETSASLIFTDESKPLEIPRYSFNQAHNLLYTGGYVKCLSWSPPFVDDEGASMSVVPNYLAIASYPNNGTRCILSDPLINEPGLIQVWSSTYLALTSEYVGPFFLTLSRF